ncbi:SDR family oxidoreductase [Microbacterium abyssi]|uniref:SDR family oxidoreductase n=1 Tax=Microbacterium abyssi TaxID=2782166 RepID=UPI001888566B|nr:NAD(P)H-binding protein [Microbacterium sp. A18JL241]
MSTPILVTGGTGNIGRHTVPLLRAEGREVRILSRHPRTDEPGVQYLQGDTVKGTGLERALEGVDTVLHLAGGAKGDDVAARNLVAAARSARVKHLVLISVVGADRMPIGYFRMKAAAEKSFENSGVPFTVLRVAQLHDFALPMVKVLSKMRLAPRGLRFESVGVQEVAERLAELTLGDPAGRVADLAGPQVREVAEMVRAYDRGRGRVHRLLPIRLPGAIGRAYRAGENLAADTATRGTTTWEEFLAHRDPQPASVA